MIYLKNTIETQEAWIPRQDGEGEYISPYERGVADGIAEQKAKLSSTEFNDNGTYVNQDGWSAVTVDVSGSSCNLQEKSEEIPLGESNITVYPDAGYDGMSAVTVGAKDVILEAEQNGYNSGYTAGEDHQKSLLTPLSATSNGTYSAATDGYYPVVVDVPQTGSSCDLIVGNVTMTAQTQNFQPIGVITAVTGIETNTGVYFDTGIIPDINTKIQIEITPKANSGYWVGFIGAQNNDDDSTTFQIRRNSNYSRFSARVGNSNGNVGTFTYTIGRKYTLTLDKDNFVIDNNGALHTYTVGASYEATCNNTLYIGAIHNENFRSDDYRSSAAIFGEVKIWQNDVLVADFVPALDGTTPCYMNTINDRYIYNLGSGIPTAVTGTVTGGTHDGFSEITVDATQLVSDSYTQGQNSIRNQFVSTAITQNGNYNAVGDAAFSSVTVNVPSCELGDDSVTMTAQTQTFYPPSGSGILRLVGAANIVTDFVPYDAYLNNGNYLRVDIDCVWNGAKNASAYLYGCMNSSTPFFTCERFRISNNPYCNIGNGPVSDGPSNGTATSTWYFEVDNGTVTTYIDGVQTQTSTVQGSWPTTTLRFAPTSDATNLNADFKSLKFSDRNGNVLAEFVPSAFNGGAIYDTVSQQTFTKSGSGSATFSGTTVYDGLSAITVDATSLCQTEYNNGYNSGYTSGETDGIALQKSLLSSTAITQNGNYSAPDGFSAVTVNVPQTGGSVTLTSRSITVSQNTQTATSPSETAWTAVTVDATTFGNYREEDGKQYMRMHQSSTAFTQSGTYQTTGDDSWTAVTVNVSGGSAKSYITYSTTDDLRAITLNQDSFYDANGNKLTITNHTYSNGLGIIEFNGELYDIHSNCFAFCTTLKNITIPNTVRRITWAAFSGCTSLEYVTLPNTLEYVGTAVFQDTAIKNIHFGDNVTEIGVGCCWECVDLEDIIVGKRCTTIGGNAFGNCTGCTTANIKRIYSYNRTPPSLDVGVFTNVASGGTLYCPYGRATAYLTTWMNKLPSGWTLSATL